MKIFLCYASEDRVTAERVFLSLRGMGHEVFFDRDSLPAGDSYDLRILEAIDDSDLMIVLLSPEAVAPGAYALTEIGFARRKWPHPARHVLPVVVRPTELEQLPPYLRSVTILYPKGDLVVETTVAVTELGSVWQRGRRTLPWVAVLVALSVAVGLLYMRGEVSQQECRMARDKAENAGRRIIESVEAARQDSARIAAEEIEAVRAGVPLRDSRWVKQRACDERHVMPINNALRDLSEAIASVESRCSPAVTIDAAGRSALVPIKGVCGNAAGHPLKTAVEQVLSALRQATSDDG